MSYSLLRETFPMARKCHRCIWCGEWIELGETYRHERSVYNGNMQDHKWHLECDKLFQTDVGAGGDEELLPYSNERPSVGVESTKND